MEVTVNGRRGTRQLGRIMDKYKVGVKKGGEAGIRDVARYAAKQYIISANQAGITPFDNKSPQYGIRAESAGTARWVVKMPKHMLAQDHMRPHFVGIFKYPKVMRWARKNYGTRASSGVAPAMRSEVLRDKSGKIIGGGLFVQPRPFMMNANRIIRAKAKDIVNKAINQKIKQARK